MKLDLTSLNTSVVSLKNALIAFDSLADNINTTNNVKETLRSGVIQNFEVAYDQTWKFMKRWIEENDSPASIDSVTRRELFRVSAENSLINNIDEWMEFHTARNLTSHTYDTNNALMALKTARSFLPAAQNY